MRNDCDKAFYVNGSEMIISADLGSSSNYSNELHFIQIWDLDFILMLVSGGWNFEGRSGEGFFAIGDHAKVSRS